ncbi:MAG: helix-turn-helix domain-containing protein [Novosphingobium sp.]|nr:TetR/AcrR family transcriptional regulator [Novosphingobium sp.]
MTPRPEALSSGRKGNRAKLAQERSRANAKKIVRAALHLWTERGFDEGYEATTVDEIAERAGISRATVYYYFPKKEDILREIAWVTAEQIHELSLRSLMSGQPVDQVIDDIMRQLGEMVSRSPPAAVRRMLQVRDAVPDTLDRDSAAGGLTRAFSVVLTHAQEAGELPGMPRSIDIAIMLSSIATGLISRWSILDDMDLPDALRRSAAIVLAGARASGDP